MIKNLNFLGKPNRDKLNLFISIGTTLFLLGIVDVTFNSFFEINITSFLPRWINFLRSVSLNHLLIIAYRNIHYWYSSQSITYE